MQTPSVGRIVHYFNYGNTGITHYTNPEIGTLWPLCGTSLDIVEKKLYVISYKVYGI